MAIIDQRFVIDGFDVHLDTGEVLHFLEQPPDVDAAVAAILQAREDARLIFVITGEGS